MYVFLLYLHLLINVDIKDVCREMLESKRIEIETIFDFETIKRLLIELSFLNEVKVYNIFP